MNKLKKFLIAGAVVVMMVASLSGCDGSTISTTEAVPDVNDRFIEIMTDDRGLPGYSYIYVDRETGVMYLFVKDGYGGGLTVMVDEEGNPLIWDEQKEK